MRATTVGDLLPESFGPADLGSDLFALPPRRCGFAAAAGDASPVLVAAVAVRAWPPPFPHNAADGRRRRIARTLHTLAAPRGWRC